VQHFPARVKSAFRDRAFFREELPLKAGRRPGRRQVHCRYFPDRINPQVLAAVELQFHAEGNRCRTVIKGNGRAHAG